MDRGGWIDNLHMQMVTLRDSGEMQCCVLYDDGRRLGGSGVGMLMGETLGV